MSEIRSDWQYLASLTASGTQLTLFDCIYPIRQDSDQSHWLRGLVHPDVVKKSEHFLVAQRFCLSNAQVLEPPPMSPQYIPRLLLENKLAVAKVTLPKDEKAFEMRCGIAIVTTVEGTDFYILSDHGRVIGSAEEGIEVIWQGILHCDYQGRRLGSS